jgi:hypothetical protein
VVAKTKNCIFLEIRGTWAFIAGGNPLLQFTPLFLRGYQKLIIVRVGGDRRNSSIAIRKVISLGLIPNLAK